MAAIIQLDEEIVTTVQTMLTNEAEIVNKIRYSIITNMQDLQRDGWWGAGANNFYNHMDDEVLPRIHRLQTALQDTKQALRDILTIFRDAEEEAAALFDDGKVIAPIRRDYHAPPRKKGRDRYYSVTPTPTPTPQEDEYSPKLVIELTEGSSVWLYQNEGEAVHGYGRDRNEDGLQNGINLNSDASDTMVLNADGTVTVFDENGDTTIVTPQDGLTIQVYERSAFNPQIVRVGIDIGDGNGEQFMWMYSGDGLVSVDTEATNALYGGTLDEATTDWGGLIPNADYPSGEERIESWSDDFTPSSNYPLLVDTTDPDNLVVKQFASGGEGYNSTFGLHPGMDFFAPAGTDVVAISDGEVVGVFDGTNYSNDFISGFSPSDEASGRGMVVVRTGNTYVVYSHLDASSIAVGTQVMEGQVIGEVGTDPILNNDHLHLEVRSHGQMAVSLTSDGDYVDPVGQRPLIVLNPARFFDADVSAQINTGLTEYNTFNDQFNSNTPDNPGTDAVGQGVQAIHFNQAIYSIRDIPSLTDEVIKPWEDINNLLRPEIPPAVSGN